MTKDISLPYDLERLNGRANCVRCGHNDWHKVTCQPMRYQVSCSLDCSPNKPGCGHLLRLSDEGETRCGDIRDVPDGYCDDNSPSIFPLIVCLTCGRLQMYL